MNIPLTTWKRLDKLKRKLLAGAKEAEQEAFMIWMEAAKGDKPETAETALLLAIAEKFNEVYELACLLPDVTPQSEWTGGNSDDPRNHKLREPNCCPLPRRKFTADECAAAGLVCHGPCDWSSEKAAT